LLVSFFDILQLLAHVDVLLQAKETKVTMMMPNHDDAHDGDNARLK